jgi:hypothetical protein
MAKFKVKEGSTLLYPDGSKRGGPGYCVDSESAHEHNALSGQMDKLEPCADYISSDAVDFVRMVAPVPVIEAIEDSLADEAPKKKPAKKKTKKKAAKKTSKKSSK